MKSVMLSLVGLSAVIGLGAARPESYAGVLLLVWLFGSLSGVPMALLLQGMFPRFLRRTSENLERCPWSSLVVGALGVLILMLASHVFLQARGVGKGLAGVVVVLLWIVATFGSAAVFRSVGSRLYLSMNNPRADQAFPSTLLGGVVLCLAALLPLPGGLALLIALAMGLGAGLITLLNKSPKPPVVNPTPPKLT